MVVKGLTLGAAIICCAMALRAGATAGDGDLLLDSRETTTDAETSLPKSPQPGELADLLGFDPGAIAEQRARAARAAEPQERHDIPSPKPTATVDERVGEYEARLLADRRVFYGYSRPIDSPTGLAQPTTQPAQERPLPAQERPLPTQERLQPVVMATQYGEAATDVVQAPNDPRSGAVTKPFSSSAYQSARDSEEAIKPKEATLELDDVEQFSREQALDASDENDNALEEDAYEETDEPAEDSLAALEDECFAALDPYTSLFIEYGPTSEWTESILEYVESILRSIEESPQESRALVAELKRKADEASAIKSKLQAEAQLRRANQNDPWNGGEQPRLVARYTLAQRIELVESFKNALERRVFLWNHAADFFAARASGALHEPQDFSRQDLETLLAATTSVRDYFGDTGNGRSWRASFDVDALIVELRQALELPPSQRPRVARDSQRRQTRGYVESVGQRLYASAADAKLDEALAEELKNDPIEVERERRVRFLHDRINAIAYKIEKTPMTREQRQVFERPTTAKWSNIVTALACDQTNGMALLVAFEKHERVAGGHSGRALQQLALRMTTSQSETCRLYGRAIDVIYDNPNVKAYVSEALINRLLPVRDPEFAVVQETVLNNPVVGQRRVDTQVSISLQPDPNRLLMSLNINGRVHANTSSAVMNAKLHNESYANYVGRKTLEWRDSGIAYSPAVVDASSQSVLNAVETDLDFVPLVGDLARGVARSQYEQRQGMIDSEARAKIVNQTRKQFDQEANARFDAVNAKMREGFFRNLANLGLSLRTQRSRTTDDWLLASLRFGAEYALGCQTNEPATLPGAFADVKIHESSINSFLTQLDLAGRSFTPEEALAYIAKTLNNSKLAEFEIEENELSFTFAKEDPVTVRFYEDRVCLILRFANLTLGQKSWDNIETEVAYRPTVLEDGTPTMIRDGAIALYGPASVMEQIPIRAVFSKIFPAQKSLDLRFEALRKDERFAGLALGLCRVSKGWFAVSVVKDAYFTQKLEKTYL